MTTPNFSQGFNSLTLALDGYFEFSLRDLPEALRQRIEQEFFPVFPGLWDHLFADQRRARTRLLDNMNDPASEHGRQEERKVCLEVDEKEREIEELEGAVTPDAIKALLLEKAKKGRIKALRQKLERLTQASITPGQGQEGPAALNQADLIIIDGVRYNKADWIVTWKAIEEELGRSRHTIESIAKDLEVRIYKNDRRQACLKREDADKLRKRCPHKGKTRK